jgi:hypothetical protein
MAQVFDPLRSGASVSSPPAVKLQSNWERRAEAPEGPGLEFFNPLNAMHPEPSAACSFTAHDLTGFLQASAYGGISGVFNCYFQPGSMPPRCNVCSRRIGEHPAASAAGTIQANPSPLNGTSRLARPNNPNAPTLTTTPEGCDVYERVEGREYFSLAAVFVLVGCIFFGVIPFPNPFNPTFRYGSSGVFWALSLCCLLLPCKITIKFHRHTQRVEYSRRRLIWCVASSTSMNLDGVHGVDASTTGCMVNKRAEYRIVLLTSQGQLLLETTTGYWTADGRAEGWRRYEPCPRLSLVLNPLTDSAAT